MNFVEKSKKFFEKLQNLPEEKKIIILWTVVAIVGGVMLFFWLKGSKDAFYKAIYGMGSALNF